MRPLSCLCDLQRCSVVVLVHGDTDFTYGAAGLASGGYVEHGEQRVASLVQELDHIVDVMISVDPLSTGLANDVHGQVGNLTTPVHYCANYLQKSRGV